MDCGYFKLGGTCDLLGLEKHTLCWRSHGSQGFSGFIWSHVFKIVMQYFAQLEYSFRIDVTRDVIFFSNLVLFRMILIRLDFVAES